jgi:hypothetical protein
MRSTASAINERPKWSAFPGLPVLRGQIAPDANNRKFAIDPRASAKRRLMSDPGVYTNLVVDCGHAESWVTIPARWRR